MGERKRNAMKMSVSQRTRQEVAASQPTGESKNILRRSAAGLMTFCVTDEGFFGQWVAAADISSPCFRLINIVPCYLGA